MAAGVRQGQKRAGGETVANVITAEESEKFDKAVESEVLPDERATKFRTPGFSRMRLEWMSQDRPIIDRAKAIVDGQILNTFADAYELMYHVYDLVRTPEVDKDGVIQTDKYGLTLWKRNNAGGYDEDFTRLTLKQKEDFLFRITTRLFEWEQRAANAWGESMFAKAQWEERFSISFDAPMAGTVDDRRAAANKDAADERYFAIYATWVSRKAEAVVRSMALLGQRLKDSME